MTRFLCTALLLAPLFGASACSSSSSPSAAPVDVGAAIAQGARGQYLMTALIDCGGCHTSGPTKIFGGGVKFPIDGAGHYVYSRNLTPDPDTGLKLTEEEFIRVFQTGEDLTNHGQQLVVMPWPSFRWMTVDDIKALYAALKYLPPVANAVPPDDKGIAAAAAPVPMPTEYDEGEEPRPLPAETGEDPLGPPGAAAIPDPGHAVRGGAILPLAYAKMPGFYKRTADEQAAFGRGSYLVNAAACNDCHTNKNGLPRDFTPGSSYLKIPADAYLLGGAVFAVPSGLDAVLAQSRTMSANLIGESGFFNEPEVSYLLFAGIIDAMAHVDDTPPLRIGWPMPAEHFRKLAQRDLMDIYTYMKILAEDYDHAGQGDKATQGQARYCTTAADCDAAGGETCFVDGSADKAVHNQCVDKVCASDDDCGACQTCAGLRCRPPATSDACLSTGR